MYIKKLKSLLNRYMDVGHIMVSKEEIIEASMGDVALAEINLRNWQSFGWLVVHKGLFEAEGEDVCVELKGYIDDDRPWSEPMSGKM